MEKVEYNKKCADCGNEFPVFEKDIVFYQKFDVPEPRRCPECRLMRRFVARNPKNLYYRKCDLTGKKILSQFHEKHPFPVYGYEDWWSDKWEALDFGRDIDFSRPFFEQFEELSKLVPRLALFNTVGTMQNSDYNNCTAYLKNCYLLAESDYVEESLYSNLVKNSKTVVDCSVCYDDELCYECVDCTKCYSLISSSECQNCRDSWFLFNCQSCSDCIGCINQRHKQYMIFNKQLTREEYEKQKQEFELHTNSGYKALEEKCEEFFKTQPHKNVQAEHNENSAGDHLYDSKNAHMCFDSKDLEDCRYCAKVSLGVKTSMDYNSWGDGCELVYQSSSCGDHAYKIKFCVNCLTNVRDMDYCIECFSSHDLFGCIGLQRKQFCILNKQYAEKEYRELKKRLVEKMIEEGEWGELFPLSVYAFAYNESLAMDAFPLTKEEAIKRGFTWKEEDSRDHKTQTSKVPNDIKDATENITNEIFDCENCGRNYKIIPQEFKFYKTLQIPVPRMCPVCRHRARMAKRNPLKLWDRKCNKCGANIQTSYSPRRSEAACCEKCYLAEVY